MTKNDVLVDLGGGYGTFVIAVCKLVGCRGLSLEIDKDCVLQAKKLANLRKLRDVRGLAKFLRCDLTKIPRAQALVKNFSKGHSRVVFWAANYLFEQNLELEAALATVVEGTTADWVLASQLPVPFLKKTGVNNELFCRLPPGCVSWGKNICLDIVISSKPSKPFCSGRNKQRQHSKQRRQHQRLR